ncbi:hypothetical protein ABPG72_005218 [Tetrahymena utriculariae]
MQKQDSEHISSKVDDILTHFDGGVQKILLIINQFFQKKYSQFLHAFQLTGVKEPSYKKKKNGKQMKNAVVYQVIIVSSQQLIEAQQILQRNKKKHIQDVKIR